MQDFSSVMTVSFWICVVPVIACWLISIFILVKILMEFSIIMYQVSEERINNLANEGSNVRSDRLNGFEIFKKKLKEYAKR